VPTPKGYAGPKGYWEYRKQVQPEGITAKIPLQDDQLGHAWLDPQPGLRERVDRGACLGGALAPDGRRAGRDPSKFVGFPTIPKGSYTSQWWVFHNKHGAFAARGVHGQTIYVDSTSLPAYQPWLIT
jgi:hypothetical protein